MNKAIKREEKIFFSVVVPIYNVENYLKRCVDSILKQTYKDFEIILVDDGSTDTCPIMCDEYSKIDSRIRVIHKDNGGLSDARNKGIQSAAGDYILFVDSDDYIEESTIEKFLPYLDMKCDILIGDAIVEGGDCDLSHINNNNNIMTGCEYLLKSARVNKSPMAAWLNAYRRDFLLQNDLQFRRGILHEDEDFTPRSFICAKSVICTQNIFYHYILRSGSISTHTDKRKNISDLYETCLRLKAIYQSLDYPLKKFMIDSLVSKYLDLFCRGNVYIYGKKYIHKWFCLQNARRIRTKLKSFLFALSPRLYCTVNKGFGRKKG